ncbi:MAG TPA: diacylglycerol kinase [Anaerolineaceae bacterium]|nr:diacylglycerol kinase [Anaerolineaceae bacterium]
MDFIKSRVESIRHAIAGWSHVIRTQKNAWIHAAATICVILLAIWLYLPARDWALLLMTIAIVWAAEFLNTALEIVVDLASPDLHPMAKAGKDVGAAAVLISATIAAVIGFLVMGPPLVVKMQSIFNTIKP